MAAIGTHLSHFIQNDTRSVLEWVSTVAKWIGFDHFGTVLERADQGFHLADAASDSIHLYKALDKASVADWMTVGRVVSKAGSLVGNVASSIDFLSHIQAITLDSGLLSRVSLIGNVASLARSAFKVASQTQKIFRYAEGEGEVSRLNAVRQSLKLVRTVARVAAAVLAIGLFMGAFAISSWVILAVSSIPLLLTTGSYLLKREIHRLEALPGS